MAPDGSIPGGAGRRPPRLTGELPAVDAQVIGGYTVVKVLGDASEGLFLARDLERGRVVTLKQLTLREPATAQGLVQFVNRARTSARIQGPRWLDVYDFVEHAGKWFAVLEPVFGESLVTRARGAPLTIAAAVTMVAQAAEALALLHRGGRAHGAITLASLFLVEREGVADFVKAIDFGRGAGDDVLVPLACLAPERRAAQPIGARADVWALGSVLFELFEGRPPDESDVLSPSARSGEPIAASLVELVSRCLQRDPSKRFSTVEAMAASLLHAAGLGDGIRASRPSSPSLPPVGLGGRQPSRTSHPAVPVATASSQPSLAPVTTLDQFPAVAAPAPSGASPRAAPRWLWGLLALPLLLAPVGWRLLKARPEPTPIAAPVPIAVAPPAPPEAAVDPQLEATATAVAGAAVHGAASKPGKRTAGPKKTKRRH